MDTERNKNGEITKSSIDPSLPVALNYAHPLIFLFILEQKERAFFVLDQRYCFAFSEALSWTPANERYVAFLASFRGFLGLYVYNYSI